MRAQDTILEPFGGNNHKHRMNTRRRCHGNRRKASGVTREMIAHWAEGASRRSLARLSKFFGIPEVDLVNGEGNAALKEEFGAYFEQLPAAERGLIISALQYKDMELKRRN